MNPATDETQILYDGKFIRMMKKGAWEFVERKNCKGIVIILAVTPAGKVILTEQFRHALGRSVIEFPAGLIDDDVTHAGESAEQAASRELLEETGYRAAKLDRLISGPTNTGISRDIVIVFHAKDLTKESAGGGDADENIRVHEVAPADVPHWLGAQESEGKLVDPKIYAGLYLLEKLDGRQ